MLVIGRDEVTDTEEGLQAMLQSNRHIWDTLSLDNSNTTTKANKNATIYPTNVIPNWNREDWIRHYGPEMWKQLVERKGELDPYNIFADTRHFQWK